MRLRVASIPTVLVGIAAWVVLSPEPAYALNPNHQCSFCHNLHDAPGGTLNTATSFELICLTCHGSGGTATQVENHTNTLVAPNKRDYPDHTESCIKCHTPHSSLPNYWGTHTHAEDGSTGGVNIRLLGVDVDGSGLAKTETPNSGIRDVVTESRGTTSGGIRMHSFADGDPPGGDGVYEGICEVCHTLVQHHRNDNSGGDHTHKVGKTCTDCHDHAKGFFK